MARFRGTITPPVGLGNRKSAAPHQRRIAAAGETVEQYNDKAARGTMLKRPGRAEEVAAAILFLASDDASSITAALLFVDGGLTAL